MRHSRQLTPFYSVVKELLTLDLTSEQLELWRDGRVSTLHKQCPYRHHPRGGGVDLIRTNA